MALRFHEARRDRFPAMTWDETGRGLARARELVEGLQHDGTREDNRWTVTIARAS